MFGKELCWIVTDYLKVQAMFSMGANTVFACDVGSVKANSRPDSVHLLILRPLMLDRRQFSPKLW